MKKVLIATASLIFLFGVFLYSYIRSLDPGELRRMLLHEVEKRIHGQCALEELEIGGFGAVYARGLRVSSLNGQRIFEIDQLNFKLSLSDLIYSKLRFTSLDIKGLKIFAEKYAGEWNFKSLKLKNETGSRNPRRLSMVAKSTSSNRKPFQIDSFIAKDAQFFMLGREIFKFHLSGNVVERQIEVEDFLVEGPGTSKFESVASYDWSKNSAQLKILKGEIEAEEVKNIYRLISTDKKLKNVSGLIMVSGNLNFSESKLIPDLKINSEKLVFNKSIKLSNVEGYWNASQIQSLMTVDVYPVESLSKLTLRPVDGNWSWPNEYSFELTSNKLVTSALSGQQFQGQLSMLVSTKVAEVSSMSLSSTSNGDSRSLVEANGGFSFKAKSGQLRVTSRDLPIALLLPKHQGMAHWQAQLMLTQHFGLDYEIHGKVQNHTSETLELGDADFHVTGQMDQDNFEFSKFSVDINGNGSLQGSGLFRFADPLGSLRSVLFMDSVHVNPLIERSIDIPETKISKAKLELRSRVLNFKSSEVGVAGGKLYADLSTKISDNFDAIRSNVEGKIEFEELLVSEITQSLPYKIPRLPLHISGFIVPQADFSLQIKSLKSGSTDLKLSGISKITESLQFPKLKISGVIDAADVKHYSIIDRFNVNSKFNLKGQLKPQSLELGVRSESIKFQLSKKSTPILLKKLNSSSSLDFEGNLESKSIRFDIFDGNVDIGLLGNLNSLESFDASAKIKAVSIDKLINSINPAMAGHFDGELNSKLDLIEYTGNPSHIYPIKIMGDFNVSKPTYIYHKSVVDMLDTLDKNLSQKLLRKIANQEKRNWQKAVEKRSRFLDTSPQTIYFENKRLQVQSLELIEEQRRFSLKTSKPFLLDLPDEFRSEGYCNTEIKLVTTSQFLKNKFKFLKDSYDEDLELVLTLEGPISKPISQSQLDVLKQKITRQIGKNIDPKKVEQAAKKAAKQAAKNLKKNLKKKGKELINQVLKLPLSKDDKTLSEKQKASTTSTVIGVQNKKMDEVEQKVKKKLRSFLQDLF